MKLEEIGDEKQFLPDPSNYCTRCLVVTIDRIYFVPTYELYVGNEGIRSMLAFLGSLALKLLNESRNECISPDPCYTCAARPSMARLTASLVKIMYTDSALQ